MNDSDQSFQVTCAVPRSGRTLNHFLNKLKSFGVDGTQLDQILEILVGAPNGETTGGWYFVAEAP